MLSRSFCRNIFPSISHTPISINALCYRSFSGSIPTSKSIEQLFDKEKVPSIKTPTGDLHRSGGATAPQSHSSLQPQGGGGPQMSHAEQTSKPEAEAQQWAESVKSSAGGTSEGNVPVSGSSSSSSSNPQSRVSDVESSSSPHQPAPSPGSSLDLFRQLHLPMPSISSMMHPFQSMMPKSIRRQMRSVESWMNQMMGQGGEIENQSSNDVSDLRDLWYDFDRELSRPVTLSLDEKENEYIAKLELKGFEKKDLSIRVQDDYLIINGSISKNEEKERKDHQRMTRSSTSSFTRVLSLPDHIKKNHIKAKYEGNTLVLTIPKDKEKIEHGRIHIE